MSLYTNGGLIGSANTATSTSASGIWTRNDQHINKKNVYWPSGPGTDPLYSSVILLLKGEGSNGSTTLTDSGPLGLTHSNNVGVTNSTTSKYFGNGAYYGAGLSHRLNYDASGTRWNFAVDNWTFECFVMLPNGFDGYGVCQITKGGSNIGGFFFDSTNMQCYTGSNSYSTPHGGITTGVWYHMAWCKTSGVNKPRMFINGIEKTVTGTASWNSSNQAYEIGRNDGGTHSTKYLDEVRITKGSSADCARYTGNFTIPAESFPTQ